MMFRAIDQYISRFPPGQKHFCLISPWPPGAHWAQTEAAGMAAILMTTEAPQGRTESAGGMVVFRLPLWKILELVNWDDDIPNWMGNFKKKSAEPSTRSAGYGSRWLLVPFSHLVWWLDAIDNSSVHLLVPAVEPYPYPDSPKTLRTKTVCTDDTGCEVGK